MSDDPFHDELSRRARPLGRPDREIGRSLKHRGTYVRGSRRASAFRREGPVGEASVEFNRVLSSQKPSQRRNR